MSFPKNVNDGKIFESYIYRVKTREMYFSILGQHGIKFMHLLAIISQLWHEFTVQEFLEVVIEICAVCRHMFQMALLKSL